ncbi:MAG: MBL fold metallo-hydrolase [Syntrophorhabdaceae bacterium]|nr:MBL fold metallo-hydrolase [Syntrophorhabdaceae bacterium]
MSKECPLSVVQIEVGPLAENAYLVGHAASGCAVVVDPGEEGEKIHRVLDERGWVLEKILVTHGHFDHVGGVRFLKEQTGAAVCIHEADAEMMSSAALQGAVFGLRVSGPPPPDALLKEGDTVRLADQELRVLHTPGHSRGHVVFLADGMAFVGDLIFAGSIGRTDLPGGNLEALLRSVREKIFTLAPETILFSGHGPATTVGEEMQSNPFFIGGDLKR